MEAAAVAEGEIEAEAIETEADNCGDLPQEDLNAANREVDLVLGHSQTIETSDACPVACPETCRDNSNKVGSHTHPKPHSSLPTFSTHCNTSQALQLMIYHSLAV